MYYHYRMIMCILKFGIVCIATDQSTLRTLKITKLKINLIF